LGENQEEVAGYRQGSEKRFEACFQCASDLARCNHDRTRVVGPSFAEEASLDELCQVNRMNMKLFGSLGNRLTKMAWSILLQEMISSASDGVTIQLFGSGQSGSSMASGNW
jgi:hypothetical protein